MRVIINADDCGYNSHVDAAIEKAIVADKITSTTIMANMEDLSGGIRLYKTFGNKISFGCHMNLTEGQPLLNSQLLLDKGFYLEKDGIVCFNGKRFFHKPLSAGMKKDIKEELSAQIECLLDNGVSISHLDSHHHIHTSVTLMGVIADVAKKYNIRKMRRMRNYVPTSISFVVRQGWACVEKAMVKNMRMPDFFCSFGDFWANPTLRGNIDLIELECHPGGHFYEEEKLLYDMVYTDQVKLINYNNL